MFEMINRLQRKPYPARFFDETGPHMIVETLFITHKELNYVGM
jgi:hypothetical protein